MTGSTPIISEEQASAAAAEAATPAPPLPRAAEPVVLPSAPVADTSVDPDAAPLTRRQAREQEKIKTAAVPAVDAEADDTTDEAVVAQHDGSDDDVVDDEVAAEPVRAADVADTVGDVPLVEEPVEAPESEPEDISAVLGVSEQDGPGGEDLLDSDSDDDGDVDERDVDEAERPTVGPTFGQGVLQEETPAEPAPFRPSFDELLTSNDSGGTQHSAPNALIFTPSPGEGSSPGRSPPPERSSSRGRTSCRRASARRATPTAPRTARRSTRCSSTVSSSGVLAHPHRRELCGQHHQARRRGDPSAGP